jgi:hypothetical protein
VKSPLGKTKYRFLFNVGVPSLLLACVGGIVWIAVCTGNPLPAVPLAVVACGVLRQNQWIMIWLSTPAEKKLLAKKLDRAPSAFLCLLSRLGRKTRGD